MCTQSNSHVTEKTQYKAASLPPTQILFTARQSKVLRVGKASLQHCCLHILRFNWGEGAITYTCLQLNSVLDFMSNHSVLEPKWLYMTFKGHNNIIRGLDSEDVPRIAKIK